MVSTCLHVVSFAFNAQQDVIYAIKQDIAQNAMIIIIKVRKEIASDVMKHVENVKVILIIASLVGQATTSMEKSVDHVIQIVKNVKVQGIFVQNVVKVSFWTN